MGIDTFRYEGEKNSSKRQNIQQVVEYILNQDFGLTIQHDKLAKMLMYNINDEDEFRKYKSTMSRVRQFLLNYGYVLKSISGIGYYILKPSQISSHCYRTYIKRASRIYDKSAFVLDRVDKLELNDDRMEELQNITKLNKELIEKVENTIMESKYYSRKNYYDSLED